MKKKMTLRIIVGMLTIILIVTGILPFMTNKTLAAENVLSDNIILVTEKKYQIQQKTVIVKSHLK